MHRMLQMHLNYFISIFIIANISLKNINVPDWVLVRLQRHTVLDKSVNHSIWKMNGAFRTSLGLVSDERAVRDLQRPHRGGHGGRGFDSTLTSTLSYMNIHTAEKSY